MNPRRGIALYIDPPSRHFLNDKLFKLSEGALYSSLAMAYATLERELTSRGISVHTADKLPAQDGRDRKLYISAGVLKRYSKLSKRSDLILSAVFAMECPLVDPEFYRELSDAQRYFKRVYCCIDSESLVPFVDAPLQCMPVRWPQVMNQVNDQIWSQTDRKWLVMINMNKLPRVNWPELYTERMRAVEFFSLTRDIDLYGIGWDGPSYRVGNTWEPGSFQRVKHQLTKYWQHLRPDPLLLAARRVYRGPLGSKAETLGAYTFSLCFENMILKGWITEKIFDCFFVGTIPIYWGAPDVEEHIPRQCFIDMRRFTRYQDLRSHLKSLSEKDIRQYKENAREFLKSPQFRPFTKEAFVELFTRIVEEDTGIRI